LRVQFCWLKNFFFGLRWRVLPHEKGFYDPYPISYCSHRWASKGHPLYLETSF
jgi:hypothetical protein